MGSGQSWLKLYHGGRNRLYSAILKPVCLVDLVHLVSFVPPNKQNKPKKLNELDLKRYAG
jgi:hypothetical protein